MHHMVLIVFQDRLTILTVSVLKMVYVSRPMPSGPMAYSNM